MPDAKLADGHLAVAKRLATTKRPTQSEIRRSISSAYYAVFHALARTCANSLVGRTPSQRPNKAWVEVYRGLNHGICKKACEQANTVEFPACIHEFADAFQQLQEYRHKADYDPNLRFSKADAETWYEIARLSVTSLRTANNVDKKAFSAWVLISSQGARNARKANNAN
ncbi:hypothetical protein DFP92_106124 [Yoonia sediminilitoris]|uniref:HEPN domain-containing protein n=1 Tax=Yoonia sediminilitoris TaxID=1286148 RepID=A0A2T6KG45_9RHOB|nr:hypothetical protein C8N45_106124 [Yoonia sediminilitoris]RCW95181.1 hypothetical protein DFP92_106124 [Yoonia sediminilitoris]